MPHGRQNGAFMNGANRRRNILAELNSAMSAVSATTLATKFNVTRQIIVADIALLRAEGYKIRAEHRGYVIEKEDPNRIFKNIVCQHSKSTLRDEFSIIVANGGRIVDIKVEHPLYGTMSANLGISSPRDIDHFIQKAIRSGASLLSELTNGYHTHTVSVATQEDFENICKQLSEIGILLGRD